MEVPDYTIVDFLGDMSPFNLSYMEPRTTNNDMWIFWSQEEGEGEGGSVQEYLKLVLSNAECNNGANVVIIQFWAPTTTSSTIGGRCVLKTSNQPFALYRIERGICEYRKHCTSLEFNVFQHEEKEYEEEDDFGSIIGRVFRDKEVLLSFENPLLDFVPKIYGCTPKSLLLPLFKPSSQCCSGVLELIGSYTRCFSSFEISNQAKVIFKEVNFINPASLESQEFTEIEEINKALQGVCTTLQLPLAQIWIPCCTSTAMAYVDNPGKRCHSPYLSCSNKFSSSISEKAFADFDYGMEDFNSDCRDQDFRTGQSIVGRALLYHKPCFCRDVEQVSMSEYPILVGEVLNELGGCCAIWLHSTHTNHDYVLEFLFPPWKAFRRVLQTALELLLATAKKQLPGFKISSVGEESCVEVDEICEYDDEYDSVIIPHRFSVKPVPESFANEKEMVQDEVVGETIIDNGSNILGLEQHGVVVCHSEKTAGEELSVEAATNDEITVRLPPMPESLQNENEVVQQLSNDKPSLQNVAVTSSERIFSRAEASEREYRTTDITLSREDLTKHFGKKLDDAAKILEVSRSTMKRALRHHQIDRWPLPKRKKVVRSDNEGIEGTYKGDPSCSNSPPTPATAGISHKTSNSRQEQDVGTVTIKATHGDDTIRFQLPFLSRKMDLVEKVTTRLPLNEGSFNIKYQDEENEWVLIACDEDLEECIGIWKGKSMIKMLVEPITNEAP